MVDAILVEGIIIGSYAIRANYAFIYIRGEVTHVVRRVQQAITDAYAAGLLGKNILGKTFALFSSHSGKPSNTIVNNGRNRCN